jgi:mono/diheme cytochrome c family protein
VKLSDGLPFAQRVHMKCLIWWSFAIPFVLGCHKDAEPAPAAESPLVSPTAQEAQTLFKTVCAVCHGENGTGNGVGAAGLDPKPRNYTDPAWQKQVTDAQIKQIIVYGGAAVGKSPVMPAQSQLAQKPEVVDELVRIVRGFGAAPASPPRP